MILGSWTQGYSEAVWDSGNEWIWIPDLTLILLVLFEIAVISRSQIVVPKLQHLCHLGTC